MLTIFRAHHVKRILIALAVMIIPAFVLWGGLAYFKTKDSDAIAEIAKRKISSFEFLPYYRMAEMQYASQKKDAFTAQLIKKTAWDYLVLNWKADKDRIKVSDEEVAKKIVDTLSFGGVFKKENYFRLLRSLRVQPRVFEEQLRNTMKIEKVYEKYAAVKIDDKQIRELYDKDTRKAKISYLLVSDDDFDGRVNTSDQEIEEFYNKNKDTFKEEAKAKIKYVIVAKDDPAKDEILKAADAIDKLDEFAAKFGLAAVETGYFRAKDPVYGIGDEPEINDFAFTLKKGEIGEAIEIKKGYCIIEKTGQEEAYSPALAEIKNEVKKRAERAAKKVLADKYCRALLERITGEKIADLKTLEKDAKVKYGETDFFRYSEFVPVLGFDAKIKNLIFSLKKNEIYKEPLALAEGSCLIQAKDISSFDQADFTAKKQGYIDYVKHSQSPETRAKYLAKLKAETGFKTYQK